MNKDLDYFEDIYLKRLNRFGNDYQSRLQAQREKNFESKLVRSVYRVEFIYQNEIHPATLERFKQDETEVLQYLLTRVSLNMPNGTILMIPNKDGEDIPWMIYYLEDIRASGYNRYIVMKMTHLIEWRDRSGNLQQTWSYIYGQEDNMLKNEIRSRSRMDTVYMENLKDSFLIIPTNPNINRDDYLEIGEGDLKEAFRVTGYDILSTPGVEYVTIDPVYIRDKSEIPQPMPDEPDDNFFWLGGVTNA